MTTENKTAIQQAEKQLEQERASKLKSEIYSYLKSELEAIDTIDSKIRRLSEEKRAHEENVKNIKQGNLKAIEERRRDYHSWSVPTITIPDSSYLWSGGSNMNFYVTHVAGTTVTTASGKTYFF